MRRSLPTSDDPDVLRAVGEACRAEVRGREVFFGYFDERQQRLAEDEAAISLLAHRDELQIYEVGPPDGQAPSRRTLYATPIFDEPRRLTQDLGLSTIRAGLSADLAKNRRHR